MGFQNPELFPRQGVFALISRNNLAGQNKTNPGGYVFQVLNHKKQLAFTIWSQYYLLRRRKKAFERQKYMKPALIRRLAC